MPTHPTAPRTIVIKICRICVLNEIVSALLIAYPYRLKTPAQAPSTAPKLPILLTGRIVAMTDKDTTITKMSSLMKKPKDRTRK